MQPLFSIITVAYNAGDKLIKTIESIDAQCFKDYEVIIKDGESKDGSVERLKACPFFDAEKMQVVVSPDQGLYDAMNEAIGMASGKYLMFVNCGDYLPEAGVLQQIAMAIGNANKPAIYYGDTFSRNLNTVIAAPPQIDAFTCYRNVPCHQACIYEKSLFDEKKYDTNLKIRADYDHFLYCFYEKQAEMNYLGFVVSSYEGGGVSENRENQKLDYKEWRMVLVRYMTSEEILRFDRYRMLTLAPLRSKLAESKMFTGIYHKIKRILYKR